MDVATRGMLVGMVLGDAHLNIRNRVSRGKYLYESRELRVLHSTQQKAYCEHKAALISRAFARPVRVTEVANGPGGRYRAAQFSVSHPYFKQLKDWCYPNGVKTFTRHVLDMLTPEGIALWYMDDGSARVNVNKDGWVSSCATDIATMCSEVEAATIKEWFKEEYGIHFNVRRNKRCSVGKEFWVQANTANSREFVPLVRPHIPPCMLYKIAHVANLSSHECRAPVGACRTCQAPLFDNRRKGMCVTCYTREWRAKR